MVFGPALEDRTKRKLMGELLNVDGDRHHTLLVEEEDFEQLLFDTLHRPTVLTEHLKDTAEFQGMEAIRFISYFLGLGPLGDGIDYLLIQDKIKGDIEETENHILMSETSRYLKNQLITNARTNVFTDKSPDERFHSQYHNGENNFNTWFKKHLHGFLARGFNEYNSNTYSGLSVAALANLYDYADDPQVKKSARIVLDFISARFATQSYDLKRNVGFCRKPKYYDAPELWWDPMAAWFSVLIGNYAGLQETCHGLWNWRKEYMLAAAASAYSVPDLILDLAIDKSHNPYEIRVNHLPYPRTAWLPLRISHPHSRNIEILSARRGYLLSAGGRFDDTDYWWTSMLGNIGAGDEKKEYHGWARPTTLITRSGQRIYEPSTLYPVSFDPLVLEERCPLYVFGSCYFDDYLIYSKGRAERTEQNNTGVFRNFAVSASSFHIPCRYRSMVIEGTNGWQFLHLTDEGLYVALNNTWNILEVMDDESNGGPSFADFRANRESQTGADGHGTYRTSEGRLITFDASRLPGSWPITEIDGLAQDLNYHNWPFIESLRGPGLNRVMWADGDGKVIINNPYLGQSLILSLVNLLHPIRIEQGCTAIDLTGTAKTCEASSNTSSARLAFDDDGQTSWTSTDLHDEWISVDFGGSKAFKFISLRFTNGFHYRIDEIRVETSSDGTTFHPRLTQEVPDWPGIGIDIEMPEPCTARSVRFHFHCYQSAGPPSTASRLNISEIEIYGYAPVPEVHPDPYEVNNIWSQAAHIEPGRLYDPTIHAAGDPDFYQVELLAGNRIRATVTYDRPALGGHDLTIQLWGWPYAEILGWPYFDTTPSDPVLLASNTSQVFDGSRITRHAEWGGKAVSGPCLVKVVPEGGALGPYTLTAQTRGPDLAGPDYMEGDEAAGGWIRLHPEPEPGSGTSLAPPTLTCSLEGRDIHTGNDWTDWLIRHGEKDSYVVEVPANYDLWITVAPVRPQAGRPYAMVYDPATVSRVEDDRSDWPNSHTLKVRPRFGCNSSADVRFLVLAEYNNTYRNDTGGYTLSLALPSPGMMSLSPICTTIADLADDLAESHDPSEIAFLLEEGIELDFDVPPIGDPYVIHVISCSTGQIIQSYELDYHLWETPADFVYTVNYFQSVHDSSDFQYSQDLPE